MYPFNMQVSPRQSLALSALLASPITRAIVPGRTVVWPPGYFSPLGPHLASLRFLKYTKPQTGSFLKTFALAVPFLRIRSSRHMHGLPPPSVRVSAQMAALGGWLPH